MKTIVPATIAATLLSAWSAELDGLEFKANPRLKLDRNFVVIEAVENGTILSGSVMIIDGVPEWSTAEIDCEGVSSYYLEALKRYYGNRPDFVNRIREIVRYYGNRPEFKHLL